VHSFGCKVSIIDCWKNSFSPFSVGTLGLFVLIKRMLPHSHTHQSIKCKHAFLEYPRIKVLSDTCVQKSPGGGGFTFSPGTVFFNNMLIGRQQQVQHYQVHVVHIPHIPLANLPTQGSKLLINIIGRILPYKRLAMTTISI